MNGTMKRPPRDLKHFSLSIDMGNDAMVNRADICAALLNVTDVLMQGATEGTIRDTNGNKVGTFQLK